MSKSASKTRSWQTIVVRQKNTVGKWSCWEIWAVGLISRWNREISHVWTSSVADRVQSPVRENVILLFFHLLHLAPAINNPHVCIKLLESHFTSFSDTKKFQPIQDDFQFGGRDCHLTRYMFKQLVLPCGTIQLL